MCPRGRPRGQGRPRGLHLCRKSPQLFFFVKYKRNTLLRVSFIE